MTIARPNAAILFAEDCYATQGERLMGRHAAGEGFLNGFFGHSGVDRLYCYCDKRIQAERFSEMAQPFLDGRSVAWIPAAHIAGLAEPGTLYIPGPGLGVNAWQRHRIVDQRAFSLCGVTHTTASDTVMKMLTDLAIAPVQSWDALICTSHAVKANVERLFQGQAEYLALRTGADRWTWPQLPVIPLGVDSTKFASQTEDRIRWRSKFQLNDEELAVLFVGRLSFHAKAHHVPMYLALEAAAQKTGKSVTFLMAGWFAHEAIEMIFREDAAKYCPSVRVEFLDGRQADTRYSIWQAADVFLSLSDNLQETFGLTPIEAMAASLPVVVSDWDGYRDTVRDGVDGFRIHCTAPAPGFGNDLAARFELGIDNYDHYCSTTSQFVAVDIEAATEALVKLFESRDLRTQMGSTGRQRAVEIYDWSVIVHQYQSLWEQLAEIRKTAEESAPRKNPASTNPAFRDPWWLFESHPTLVLRPDDRIVATPNTDAEIVDTLLTGGGTCPGSLQAVLASADEMKQLIDRARTESTLRELVNSFPAARQPLVMRSSLWLMKYGVLSLPRRS